MVGGMRGQVNESRGVGVISRGLLVKYRHCAHDPGSGFRGGNGGGVERSRKLPKNFSARVNLTKPHPSCARLDRFWLCPELWHHHTGDLLPP